MTECTRRKLLKLAGASIAGAGASPVSTLFAAASGQAIVLEPQIVANPEALSAKRWGMVVDSRKIRSPQDLTPIIKACHTRHNVPTLPDPRHEIKWIWEVAFENAFPELDHPFLNVNTRTLPFPVLCNHCKNPPCVRVCPTGATFRRESDGVVLMDYHRCIGCRFCMAACPYGSRSFNFRDPAPFIGQKNQGFPTRTRGVVEKCNFCAERLEAGKLPACVEASGGILTFGDLEDPKSEARRLLDAHYTIRRKEALGTEPNVYYIV